MVLINLIKGKKFNLIFWPSKMQDDKILSNQLARWQKKSNFSPYLRLKKKFRCQKVERPQASSIQWKFSEKWRDVTKVFAQQRELSTSNCYMIIYQFITRYPIFRACKCYRPPKSSVITGFGSLLSFSVSKTQISSNRKGVRFEKRHQICWFSVSDRCHFWTVYTLLSNVDLLAKNVFPDRKKVFWRIDQVNLIITFPVFENQCKWHY